MTAVVWAFEPLEEKELEELLTPARENKRDDKPLLCSACGRQITTRAARIDVDGAHQHTFTNPVGLVFTIGCFADAPGCGETGVLTEEWTWFSACRWRYAHCRGCLVHLGWGYRSEAGDHFFGLILARLVEPS